MKTYKSNYYQILEVSDDASQDDIKKSYYRLCKKYHPDINYNSLDIFNNIREAYDILSNTTEREYYNQWLQTQKNYTQNVKSKKQETSQDTRSEYQIIISQALDDPLEFEKKCKVSNKYQKIKEKWQKYDEQTYMYYIETLHDIKTINRFNVGSILFRMLNAYDDTTTTYNKIFYCRDRHTLYFVSMWFIYCCIFYLVILSGIIRKMRHKITEYDDIKYANIDDDIDFFSYLIEKGKIKDYFIGLFGFTIFLSIRVLFQIKRAAVNTFVHILYFLFTKR